MGLLVLFATLLSLALPSGAQADIYWTAEEWIAPGVYEERIGRADLDGSNVDPEFITGIGAVGGLALDDEHLYWAVPISPDETRLIGRANLDGTGVDPAFVASGGDASDVAVDGDSIYWTTSTALTFGGVGCSNLDGSGANQYFIHSVEPPPGHLYPLSSWDLALDGEHLYWGVSESDTSGHVPMDYEWFSGIARANLDGTGVEPAFIDLTGTGGGAIAVDASHIYWITHDSIDPEHGGGAIARAKLDGTEVDEGFITGLDWPVGLALDAEHLYWGNATTDTIGRANLDGTGVDKGFIAAGPGIRDIAVDSTVPAPPAAPSSCPPPPPNDFRLGKLKRDLKQGTARLPVRVPGPGTLYLRPIVRARGRTDHRRFAEAGKVVLRVGALGETRRRLAERGKVAFRVKVTYRPSPGDPNSKVKRVTLKRRGEDR